MTSTALAGRRCRTNKWVESPQGRIAAMSEGRIRYVCENLGRLLVRVDWDRGGSAMLFPEEIELFDVA